MTTRLFFDWDAGKARSNRSKHGVAFDQAMEVFTDPPALSRLDDAQVGREERWLTLGRSGTGRLVLVVHTHVELSDDRIAIRIISARPATRRETLQYEEGPEG